MREGGTQVLRPAPTRRVRRGFLVAGASLAVLFGFGQTRAEAAVYCVAASDPEQIDPSCTAGKGFTTIQGALTDASANSVADTVRIGPGTFTESNLSVSDDYPLTIIGSGMAGAGSGGTTITAAPAGGAPATTVLSLYTPPGTRLALSDLKIALPSRATGDSGLEARRTDVSRVAVQGFDSVDPGDVGVELAGSKLSDSSVNLPLTGGNTAVDTSDGAFAATSSIEESELQGNVAVTAGYGLTTNVTRSTLTPGYRGVGLRNGTVNLESSLIDLNGGNEGVMGIEVETAPFFADESATFNIEGLTMVGGGNQSKGVRVVAQGQDDTASVTADGVILSGPQTSLQAFTGGAGAPGASASIEIAYSSFDATAIDLGGDPAAEGVVTQGAGNKTSTDPAYPGFSNAVLGDYRLTDTSPLLDSGNPAFDNTSVGPPTDLLGNPRAMHKAGANCSAPARADIGAYEFVPEPPTAVIGGGPPEGATTADSTPTFTLSTSLVCAKSFRCSLDSSAPVACSSPYTTPVLADGSHTLEVRALGEAGETGPTVSRGFKVLVPTPNTTIAGKSKFKAKGRTARVSFTLGSDQPGATFGCKVVTSGYRSCAKKFSLKLRPGRYTLRVRATAAGKTDPTPAVKKFRVVK